MNRTPLMNALVLITCLALAACQSLGNGQALTTNATDVLRPGQSTRADVERAWGQASITRFESGYEVWVYQQTHGLPKFLNYLPYIGLITPAFEDRTTEVAVLFSPDGLLRKMDRRDGAVTSASDMPARP